MFNNYLCKVTHCGYTPPETKIIKIAVNQRGYGYYDQ